MDKPEVSDRELQHERLLALLARWERETPEHATQPNRITTRALKGLSR